MAQNYTYATGTYNGCDLHIIRTEAWNIVMGGLRQEKTLASGYFYGINGGFFDAGTSKAGNTKEIALNNNTPIYYKTQNGKDTGGWHNKMGHACLCYDNANKKLVFRSKAAPSSSGLNKDMSSGDSLDNVVAASARYWAQGGPDFRLGMPDGSWEEDLSSEIEYMNVNAISNVRTCICANLSANMVYLIISTSKATISEFRKAVHSYLYVPTSGYHTNVVGIFLDGGSSTSMRCKDNSGNVFSFGYRKLEQIIALRDVN